jgi:glycosyltransferase involved in cell wall biosynthesis
MKNNIKISVALCTYNGEKYIKEQIISILKQSKRVDEIIISDDNSSDITLKIVNDLLSDCDIAYKICTHETNVGVTRNFMECISKCSGDIIFTCDQDDVWKENKVEKMIKPFDDKKVSLVFANAELVDKDLNSLNCTHWDTLRINKEKIDSGLFDILLNTNVIAGSSMAFRKSIFEKIVPNEENMKLWHDELIALYAYAFGKIVAIDENLIYYRQHGNNVVGTCCSGRKLIFRKIFKKKINMSERKKRYENMKERKMIRCIELSRNCMLCLNENDKDKLIRCINFWRESLKLSTKSKFQGIKWIVKNDLNGNYKLFSNGKKAVLRDCILLFYRK